MLKNSRYQYRGLFNSPLFVEIDSARWYICNIIGEEVYLPKPPATGRMLSNMIFKAE